MLQKTLNRIIRLENKLDDREKIRSLEQECLVLRRRTNALAEYLNLQFKEGTTAVIKKEVN